MTMIAMRHKASGRTAFVQNTDHPGVVRARIDRPGDTWISYPKGDFERLGALPGAEPVPAAIPELKAPAPASPAMQEAMRRAFRSTTHAFVEGAEWADPQPREVPTRLTVLGELPVDVNTIDRLDKTITDLRDHMNGMRDERMERDGKEYWLRLQLREAQERAEAATLCVEFAKAYMSEFRSANRMRGLRKRLQKSLKNV